MKPHDEIDRKLIILTIFWLLIMMALFIVAVVLGLKKEPQPPKPIFVDEVVR